MGVWRTVSALINNQLTIAMNKTKQCIDCKCTKKLSMFYKQKTHSLGRMCYCKTCFNQRCQERWVSKKIKAINYKGSKCNDCFLSLNEVNYAVFDFHHLNPGKKEFEWDKIRLKSWDNAVKELDKCILLCSNCHRIRHSLGSRFS